MQNLDSKKSWPIFIIFAIIVLGVVGYACWTYKIDCEKEPVGTNVIVTTSPTVTSTVSSSPSVTSPVSENIYKVNYAPKTGVKFSFQFEMDKDMIVIALPVFEGPPGVTLSLADKNAQFGYTDTQLTFGAYFEDNGNDNLAARNTAKASRIKSGDGDNFKDVTVDGAPGFSYDILGLCGIKTTEFFKSGYTYKIQTGCVTDEKLYNKVLNSFKFNK